MAPVQRYAELAEYKRRLARTAARVQVQGSMTGQGEICRSRPRLVPSCFMALKPCQAGIEAGVARVVYGDRWPPPSDGGPPYQRTGQDEFGPMDERVALATGRPRALREAAHAWA